MLKRTKGNGSIPRKLTAILTLAAMSMSGYAADNSIYVDQAGDNSTIEITHDGAGNTVRGLPGVGTSSITPEKIWGNNNTVVVDQIGSSNMLRFGIDTTTGGTGTANIRYSVTGNNADATIKSMNPGLANNSPIIDVQQLGNFSVLNIDQTGPNNSITAVQSGGNNNSLSVNQSSDTTSTVSVNQTGGGGNTTAINQSQGKNDVSLITLGATNTTTINQTGDNQAVINITGSGNNTALTQSNLSGGNNIFNYAGVGSGNNVTVIQNK